MRRAALILLPLRAVRVAPVSLVAPVSRAFAAAAQQPPPAPPILLPGKPFSECTVGVPRETDAGERRVAAVPKTVAALIQKGFTVKIERGAGDAPGSSRAFATSASSARASAPTFAMC